MLAPERHGEILNLARIDNERKLRLRRRWDAWAGARDVVESALDGVVEAFNEAKPPREIHILKSPHTIGLGHSAVDCLGAIQLSFTSEPLPYWRTDGDGVVRYYEDGAALLFAQATSGRIAVVRYPFNLTHGAEEDEREDVDTRGELRQWLEPSEVTGELVVGQAVAFIEWALGTSHRADRSDERIGFRLLTAARPMTSGTRPASERAVR